VVGPTEPAAITAATLLATKALEGFAGQVGETTWAGMSRLMDLVRHKVTGHRQAEVALRQVQQHPEDSKRVWELGELLATFAAQDDAFHRELAALVADARSDPTIGPLAAQVYGQARVGQLTNIGQIIGNVYLLGTPTLAAAQVTQRTPPSGGAGPPKTVSTAEDALKAEDIGASLPTVEDDLRALEELKSLLHESVYVRFQERILFRRFPHLGS
jgi:hypothetical protein